MNVLDINGLTRLVNKIKTYFVQKTEITTGSADGNISVAGTDVPVKGLKSAAYKLSTEFASASHNQASNTINAMTGYSKPNSTSAISTSDTLNQAIGKLEKNDSNIIDMIPNNVSDLTNDSGFITGVSWDDVDDKPSTFLPSSHEHAGSEVKLTGYSIGNSETAITTSDTVNSAIGKLEKGLSTRINKSVNDLTNYYNKTNSYSKTEVDNMISAIPKFDIEVVNSLPSSNISETTIYLLNTGNESGNVYTEYIYANNNWEKLGTQTLDLSGYALKSDITTGSTNGTISVDGTPVSVYGLGSLAYLSSLSKSDVGLGNVDNTADANKSVSSAATLTTARTIDGVSFNGSANIIHYGACSTAAATTPKVLACTGFTLATGAEIIVKFNNTNTASNPQLNVNSTGAKYIRYKNVNVSAGYLEANRLYHLVYDGSYYQIIDGKPDSDNTNIIINDSSTIPSSIENGDLWFQLTGDTSITNGENEQF